MVEREGKEKGVETRLHGCCVECCLGEGRKEMIAVLF